MVRILEAWILHERGNCIRGHSMSHHPSQTNATIRMTTTIETFIHPYHTTMLEMNSTAIITTDEHDLDDFLNLSAFPAAGATFSLSAWSAAPAPCHASFEQEEEEEENHHNDHPTSSIPLSWRRPPCESNDSSSASSSSNQGATRVRFSADISSVRIYDKPTAEDWSRLYYSCHELQKIVDEYRQEEEEWKAECACLETGASQSQTDSSTTTTTHARVTEITDTLYGTTEMCYNATNYRYSAQNEHRTAASRRACQS